MNQVPLAGFAGAVTVFAWGMVAWIATPLHDGSIRALPNEAAVVRGLQAQPQLDEGLYVVPGLPTHLNGLTQQQIDAKKAAWNQQHRQGPIATILVKPQGGEPMSVPMLVGGFLIDLVAACIAAFVLSLTMGRYRDYLARVGIVALLGVFSATTCHISYWNWMWFPIDHTLAMFVDVVVAWILAGLLIAALIRPSANPAHYMP